MYKIIIISLFIFAANLFAQGKISGRVTDVETGNPLIGANIFIPKEKTGAATIGNGKYIVKTNKGKYNIEISYLGYKTIVIKDVEVDSESNLNIALPRDDNFVMPNDLEKLYLDKLPEETQKRLNELKNLNIKLYQRLLQETYFENLISQNSNNKSYQILNQKILFAAQAEKYKKAEEKYKMTIQNQLKETFNKLNTLKEEKRNIELDKLQKRIVELQKENKMKQQIGNKLNEYLEEMNKQK